MREALVLIRSDAGDGGWSLHVGGMSDEEYAEGGGLLLTGEADKTADGEWSRPNKDDYAEARRIQAARAK